VNHQDVIDAMDAVADVHEHVEAVRRWADQATPAMVFDAAADAMVYRSARPVETCVRPALIAGDPSEMVKLSDRLFWIGAEEDRAEMVREARLLLDLVPSGPVHAELGRVWPPDTPTPGDGTWTERHTHPNRAARRANHKGNRR
jgi:hypothetical protein